MKEKELEILGHMLGVYWHNRKSSERKKDKYLPDEFFRDYFCAGDENHHDYETLVLLEKEEYIKRSMCRGQLYFFVTELGKEVFRQEFKCKITDTYKPLSKSKERYLEYIDSEYSGGFEEFLGIELPEFERNYKGLIRYQSKKYYGVCGDWCKTQKEAKKTYKESLNKYLKEMREL